MESEVELCVEVGSNIGDTWVENADINQLCRSCANTHDNMIPIFEGDGLEHDLQNKIDKHFPVNISRDDGLPHQMCYQCASTLVAWHDMYMGCIDAENKLKNLLKKSTAKGQVEKTVAGSSIASAVSASVEPDSQQKMASEMEVDNDDNDDDDDDDVPEHGGDDNDDEEDDDDDNDDEDEEVEEIVLHKLEAKAKEKNVEVNEKGTTIRDQIMVLRKDNNQMQTFSFVLQMNGNEKALELSTDFPECSDFEGNLIVIKEAVKLVRQKNRLKDDDTLVVKVKSTHRNDANKSEGEYDFIDKIDKEAENINSATTGPGYYCKDCNLRYRRKRSFDIHMKTHDPGNKSKESELLSNKDEQQLKTKNNLYCENCNKCFTSRSGLRYHMRHNHLSEIKHACEFCGQCFAQKGEMMVHRRIHTGERPYICQVCGKAVRTSNLLNSHLKLHSDERPYSCQTCNMTFKFSHALFKHNRVHTGERNYVCELCGKGFASRTCLKRHMMSHTGLKPYPCPLCSSTFNQKRYLKQHLSNRHGLDPREACTIVQNIEKQEIKPTVDDKHHQDIPVNDTVDALDLLQNVEVEINETEEALDGV